MSMQENFLKEIKESDGETIKDISSEIFMNAYTNECIGKVVEVELRYNIGNKEIFNNIFDEISGFIKPELIITTDYTDKDNKRVTVSVNPNKVQTIIKTVIWEKKIHSYRMKAAVSNEKAIDSQLTEEEIIKNAILIRSKNRNRFKIGNIYLDMTKVLQSKKGKDASENYEIELETVPPMKKEVIDELGKFSDWILKKITESEILYTENVRRDVIARYNFLLGEDLEKNSLGKTSLSQARNLKKKECVWTGLIKGEKGISRYAVTLKAEGLRKILFFHESGLWLLNPPHQMNRITAIGFEDLSGTVLDGELILKNMRQGKGNGILSKYLYLPIDVISYNGKSKIQQRDLFQRLKIRDEITENLIKYQKIFPTSILPIELITFHLKPFALLEQVPPEDEKNKDEWVVSNFNQVISKMNSSAQDAIFKTDGLIFTPVDVQYNTKKIGPINKKNRVLMKHPDICKLKEWKDLTIDFYLGMRKADKQLILQVMSSSQNKTLSEFKGSNILPFDQKEKVLWNHHLLSIESVGTIIEFGPIEKNGIIFLVPIRKRKDKSTPNPVHIANDVWEDINRPFNVETLEGKTIDLAMQFHTKSKRKILSSIPEGADIIDLGAGVGGDIVKIKHARKVLAVEPNPKYTVEYQRRLQVNNIPQDKFKILTLPAEDDKGIVEAAKRWFGWGSVKKTPLYVISMLSLSFFWKDEETLKGLARTLQEIRRAYGSDVHFIFMTIEAERTLNLVNKYGPRFVLGQSSFNFSEPNILNIDIKGKIVVNQTEYLVRLPLLEKEASLVNMKYGDIEDRERFLSKVDRDYNSMFVSGTAIISESKTIFPEYVKKKFQGEIESQPEEISLPISPLSIPNSREKIAEFLSDFPGKLGIFRNSTGSRIHSFINAFLRATEPKYETLDLDKREITVKKFLNDISKALGNVNVEIKEDDVLKMHRRVDPRRYEAGEGKKIPINSYYFTLQEGKLQKLFIKVPGKYTGYNYITRILNSEINLPHRVYQFIFDWYRINVYIYHIVNGEINLLDKIISPLESTKTVAFLKFDKDIYEPISWINNEKEDFIFS